MDSNSTLVPNPQSSSQEGERSCVKEDLFAMATYNDNQSKSDLDRWFERSTRSVGYGRGPRRRVVS